MDVTSILLAVIAMLGGILGASGFWAWLMGRETKKNATTTLILGLAHERIVDKGMFYIERGWITKDEYEDLVRYLWDPYEAMGGNGLAKKVIENVSNLRVVMSHATMFEKDKYE